MCREYLFLRKGFRTYYIAYRDVDRIFRRVRTVTANVCCEGGEFRFDYLVVYKDGEELMEIQLPGEKAGKILFEDLKAVDPECELTAPEILPDEEGETA
ncbi:MAG: hypothetical protein K6F53_13055 [Lachnospiraceae bacterium]|nr:hypothetical protein [Lachnospiraceae bacterium]